MTKRVVITGAAGNLGSKLAGHLSRKGGFDLRLLDVAGGEAIIKADLTRYDESWAAHFEDADAVVHLAADGRPMAPWSSIVPLNVDILLNVYEAARQQKTKRIVFASSNWVVGGHRFGSGPITPETPPEPINPYGASKLFGERLGKSLSDRTGISVINVRIGYVQPTPGNRPGAAMKLGAWGQSIWLSDRDFQQAFEKAITVPDIRYATLNVASANKGGRFEIAEARRVLGFEPEDSHTVAMPLYRRTTNGMAWIRDVGVSKLRGVFNPDW